MNAAAKGNGESSLISKPCSRKRTFSSTIIATLAALALIATPAAQAVPPANDQAAGAEVMGTPFPDLSGTYDITDATVTGDPSPLPSASCTTGTLTRSIWFKITPSHTATYKIWAAAEGPTGTTVDDTVMAVYSSAAGPSGPFKMVGCDDDSATNEEFQSIISTELNVGTDYYIVVWKFDNTLPTAGNVSVQIRIDRSPVPPLISGSSPASGANDNNPEIVGSAETGSTVRLYTDSACTSAVAATGMADAFLSPGLTVTVSDDSTTTFYATAQNAIATSPCSASSLTYAEVTAPPGSLTGAAPPTATGERAAALKKCKKKKGKARKRCKRKANLLPV